MLLVSRGALMQKDSSCGELTSIFLLNSTVVVVCPSTSEKRARMASTSEVLYVPAFIGVGGSLVSGMVV